ncbi:MAG TPA: hypothetical protein VF980_14730 [Thermoanaerobaculia bacterium]
MGNEAKCLVELDGKTAEAKAVLETEELVVRTPFKVTVRFAEMSSVDADDERLHVKWGSHALSLAIGRDARKWAEKIRNPKPLADKLGIKAGQKISIVGKLEAKFIEELQQRGADVAMRLRRGSDIVFLAIDAREDADRMVGIKEFLAPAGAIWVVRPKGTDAISDIDVIAAARRSGLVDVKVARFSASHTAEKFVIPARDRN